MIIIATISSTSVKPRNSATPFLSASSQIISAFKSRLKQNLNFSAILSQKAEIMTKDEKKFSHEGTETPGRKNKRRTSADDTDCAN